MKKFLKTMLVVTVLCALLAPMVIAEDDYAWKAADSSEAIRVKYKGSATATIQIAAAAVTVVDDGNSTAIALTTAFDIDDLTAAVAAVTNASGVRNFECQKWAALGADTVSNKFIAASAATLTPNLWEYHAAWDTSGAKHYDVVPSGLIRDTIQGAFVIDRITGEPDGTGAVTVNVYENDTVVWKKTFASPVYVPALVAATNTAVNTISLDEEVGIRAKEGIRYLIRATRATTATTGGIGVSSR